MGIIDYLSKLVWEHLEGEMDRMKVSTMKSVTKDRYAERQKSMLRPVHDMAQFVTKNFDFRHNVLLACAVLDKWCSRRCRAGDWGKCRI